MSYQRSLFFVLTCLTTSCLSFTVHHQGRPFSRLAASKVHPDSDLPDHPSLGILRLDYSYPPIPGDMDHAASFGYPVHYKIVKGLTFAMCKKGKLTEDVGKEFDEAVDYLVERGVKAITGDCGFMQHFQKRARNRTKRPVFISSLIQLPTITAAFSQKERIMVVTANGESLEGLREQLKKESRIDTDDTRFIFVGCEDVPDFGDEVRDGKRVYPSKAQPGIVSKVLESLETHTDVTAILMECTELPHYSEAVRVATGLPVFDSITNCDMVMSSFLDSKRFGEPTQDFYKPWDRTQIDETDYAAVKLKKD
jgi:Asp/Glu/hydantoin racemase